MHFNGEHPLSLFTLWSQTNFSMFSSMMDFQAGSPEESHTIYPRCVDADWLKKILWCEVGCGSAIRNLVWLPQKCWCKKTCRGHITKISFIERISYMNISRFENETCDFLFGSCVNKKLRKNLLYYQYPCKNIAQCLDSLSIVTYCFIYLHLYYNNTMLDMVSAKDNDKETL